MNNNEDEEVDGKEIVLATTPEQGRYSFTQRRAKRAMPLLFSDFHLKGEKREEKI
jgi:hypothetical protein